MEGCVVTIGWTAAKGSNLSPAERSEPPQNEFPPLGDSVPYVRVLTFSLSLSLARFLFPSLPSSPALAVPLPLEEEPPRSFLASSLAEDRRLLLRSFVRPPSTV